MPSTPTPNYNARRAPNVAALPNEAEDHHQRREQGLHQAISPRGMTFAGAKT